ncbi:metallophosphoesterase family protein [Propionimicrobium sp. PCR01-08-3]|uniref:purple acid phosphatase family protein n=1 Tax=Propionimicrobium sp. PCR01-08-3 TaxID=3052086 RepID=UPI00255CB05E|nr:metallophosphoesterase family protein [Propionimicrobium sp. PCR01-08-3]WIY83614.1 metallophosphoesterase family protein [Propionimicrobium sp. PCR01-08-3]
MDPKTSTVTTEAAPASTLIRGRLLVTDLEVLTVTPTSAVISWVTHATKYGLAIPEPIAAGTEVMIGKVGGPMQLVHDDPTPRVYHVVEISGLEPGCTYRFRASSDGQLAAAALRPTKTAGCCERTRQFTTLTLPKGRYLSTIAVVNDIHIGEHRQGIVLGALPTSVLPHADQADYPRIMAAAALDELTSRHQHPLLIANGDITYDNAPEQNIVARELLDGYGRQNHDWVATRGNHDHPRRDDDPFGEYFAGYQQTQTVTEASGLRVLAMDSTRGSGGGWITPDQYEQIMTELIHEPERPTLACTHHPVTTDAAWSSASGPQFMLRGRDRLRLQLIERQAPGVFLHLAGHTHRMRRNRADLGDTNAHYLENAACAAYPGGFTLVHLFEGGYLVNFWRLSDPEALRWIYRSRWQSLGIGAHLMLGSTADRNHRVDVDLSGLIPSGRPVPAELVC